MPNVHVELDQDVVTLLEERHRPVREAARELIVLELYREGELSSGRAAEVLGLTREAFIRFASTRGVPYFQIEPDELRRELDDNKAR
jgi:predicted HTH domain antitoxin